VGSIRREKLALLVIKIASQSAMLHFLPFEWDFLIKSFFSFYWIPIISCFIEVKK
jgi:hypothetical protein